MHGWLLPGFVIGLDAGGFLFQIDFLCFFLCVFCLLMSELLSGFGCPLLWCALLVVSLLVLVSLGSWLCVSSIVSSSLFAGKYSLLGVIGLLR